MKTEHAHDQFIWLDTIVWDKTKQKHPQIFNRKWCHKRNAFHTKYLKHEYFE